jgi:hypothetical protein
VFEIFDHTGYPFQPDVKPSMSVAFADHLLAHKPGQMSEDVNQAAEGEA